MLVFSLWDVHTEKMTVTAYDFGWFNGLNYLAGSWWKCHGWQHHADTSCPASSQSLIAKGRRWTLLPLPPFCWVQRKGPRNWRRPPAIMQEEMQQEEQQFFLCWFLSLNKELKGTVCVEPGMWNLRVFTEFLPLFKALISTSNISPFSSSLLEKAKLLPRVEVLLMNFATMDKWVTLWF